MDVGALVDELMTRAGDLWFAALVGSFFVMICEAAKPKREKGEAVETQPFGVWVSICSLVTPFLLSLPAFVTASGALIAIIAAIGAAILGSAVIGWIIAAAAPGVGRTLNRAAPILALAVFALTLYVTWQSAFT